MSELPPKKIDWDGMSHWYNGGRPTAIVVDDIGDYPVTQSDMVRLIREWWGVEAVKTYLKGLKDV